MNPRGRDPKTFGGLMRVLARKEAPALCPGRLIIEISQFFIGTPYRAGTLETEGVERLVVNLRELDCFTFVENAVVMALVFRSCQRSFKAYSRLLQKVRYRQGRLQGYASRLHYFSDWIHDNEKKGILKDVTGEIGGRPCRKTINFMTTHPELYPRLNDPANLREMRVFERGISRRACFFIRKGDLRGIESHIEDGDLIAITTNREGLDVQHVGIAARMKKRIHLLHASSKEGRVVLSSKTLYRYLMQSEDRSGIMVARILA